MSKIYLLNKEDYTLGTFKGVVEGLNLSSSLKESKRIIIKPNITTSRDENECHGCTTPLWLLKETVEWIFAINPTAEVYIVESDSGRNGRARDKFNKEFFRELEKRFRNLHLYNLRTEPRRIYDFKGEYFKKEIEMSEIFSEDHFFISMAKIKTHSMAVYTGILKNQFGCLSLEDKSIYHPFLDRVLADVNRFIKPDLSILDGCPAMEGHGPLEGKSVNLGLIAVSDNPCELDGYMARKTGLDIYKIPYMDSCRKSLKEEYGEGKVEIINEVLTEKIKTFEYLTRIQIIRVKTGLFIQKIGQKAVNLGKKIQKIK